MGRCMGRCMGCAWMHGGDVVLVFINAVLYYLVVWGRIGDGCTWSVFPFSNMKQMFLDEKLSLSINFVKKQK